MADGVPRWSLEFYQSPWQDGWPVRRGSVEITAADRKKCRILPLARLLSLWSAVQDAARKPGRLHLISATGTDPERHWLHPVPTLEICLRGVVRLNRGRSQPIDLHPGDAAVVAPGAVHEHAPLRRGAAALGLGFDYGVCDLALIDADISIPAFLPQQPALHLVNRLLRNDATALPAVLALILEHHLQEARPLPEPVVRMRDRIRTHGLTPITAADLAHISGLGTSRAWEIFRHHLGCTPRQALERRRCAVAAAMLTQGMSVTSVTTRCGFGDRGTFARAFARIHGTTPSAWQRRKH